MIPALDYAHMAIPKDHGQIATNLPASQLEKVLEALEEQRVQMVDGSYSVYAESRGWQVDFEGARYTVGEFVELVCGVSLVSGSPSFVQSLIDEHERDLDAVVKARDYDAAKEVNAKIESLKKLL